MRTHMRYLVPLFTLAALAIFTPNSHAQQNGGQIPARTQINRNSAPQQNSQPARPPEGWEMTADQEKWIDQILKYWESESDKVQRFACQFERWEYNPAFIKDPNVHWTQAIGEIKYEKPDKAVYRVTTLEYYQPSQQQGQRGTYIKRDDAPGEYWLCDGKSIYEFDHRNKQVKYSPLPEHMQGVAIAEGPLPFLFGAKAAKLKQRYWFKPLTPPKDPRTGKFVQGEYWLAAKPKTRQDAENFSVVELIIDQQDFLPKAMQIYMPGGEERKVFKFAERDVNPRQRLLWQDSFIKPDVPRGWKLVREGTLGNANASSDIGQRRPLGASHIPVAQQRR